MFEIKHRVIAIDWPGELGNIRTVQFFKRNPEDLLDLAWVGIDRQTLPAPKNHRGDLETRPGPVVIERAKHRVGAEFQAQFFF